MLKGHPKGLFVMFFANMGERFGFYTMVAIFVMFLQAKYGFSPGRAGFIYSSFVAAVYFLPLMGGIIADRLLGYGKTISIGMVIMFIGYLLLAIPTNMGTGLPLIISALAVIALGTGLFKGNLQALVGNLYDDPKYSSKRDVAFNIFYMGINVGAMFAPTAAEEISKWVMAKHNLLYKKEIPELANKFLNNELSDVQNYLTTVKLQAPDVSLESLGDFSTKYINALSESYHYGFGVACLSLIISMLIFWGFRKHYKQADLSEAQKAKSAEHKDKMIEMSPQETKERLIALGLVFFVVIFFWMSFHQNAVTMTLFARDYTVDSVGKLSNLWFDLFGLLPVLLSVVGLVFVFRKTGNIQSKFIGGLMFIGFAFLAYERFMGYSDENDFTPQKFQHFNPFFIVALTPVIVGLFNYLRNKGKEPSAPRKIAYGMLMSAVGIAVLAVGSISLIGVSPVDIKNDPSMDICPPDRLVSVYWLINTYFVFTVAELFLSPMGISFVSKVSPPKYKGLMQGGWLAATGTANFLLFIPAILWDKIPLWGMWSILVAACLMSALFIFSILKRLEKIS